MGACHHPNMADNTTTSGNDDEQPAPALWALRRADGSFTAYNERGGEIPVGLDDEPGTFSPGELLQLALATCNLGSIQHLLASRLGQETTSSVGVSTHRVRGENRYGSMDVEILADLSSLPEERREKVIERLRGAADRQCTVGRTLAAGASYDLRIINEAVE